jgi:hypothetical protein
VSFPDLQLKSGDVLVLALAGVFTAGLFLNAWSRPAGNTLVVRSQGKLMVRASLERDADYAVTGILGLSRIEIRHGRARVAADPGPRQICVRQGWVSRAGEAALCLANQVSLEIGGADKAFDSVSY